MKTTLTHFVKRLLLPPLWCCRTVQEASRMVSSLDGIGFADFDCSMPTVPRRAVLQVTDRRSRPCPQDHLGRAADCSSLAIR